MRGNCKRPFTQPSIHLAQPPSAVIGHRPMHCGAGFPTCTSPRLRRHSFRVCPKTASVACTRPRRADSEILPVSLSPRLPLQPRPFINYPFPNPPRPVTIESVLTRGSHEVQPPPPMRRHPHRRPSRHRHRRHPQTPARPTSRPAPTAQSPPTSPIPNPSPPPPPPPLNPPPHPPRLRPRHRPRHRHRHHLPPLPVPRQ